MIPYGRQDISEEDIQAVAEVLMSEYLTQGPAVPSFEKAVADYTGAAYGVAVNSATSALHIACLALEVGNGDIVWTSPISFVASSNCALYCGASIDFVDIDPLTYNMSVDTLAAKLEIAEKEGKLPKVVIPVHLSGQSCDMRSIKLLGEKYGFSIIEDASHAIGGKYLGEPIGNSKYSDITIFSFHPVKIITTGEGGMALTNNLVLANKMTKFRSHGITRVPEEMTCTPHGPWYYQQLDLGFNYRMTDMQAALGLSQMKRIDEFVSKRHEIANKYDELLANCWFTLPFQHPDTYSAYHLYIIRLKTKETKFSHREIFDRLRSHGILVNLHYIPIYSHPYYQKMGFDTKDFPEAEAYYSTAISIPIYASLTTADQQIVVDSIKTPLGYQNLF
jgi:UDP-4-amino-4,6-dideoxy-N-acetyl-beta-L-altrosamine transaminase